MAPMTCGVCNRIKGKFRANLFTHGSPASVVTEARRSLEGTRNISGVFQKKKRKEKGGLLLSLLKDAEVLASTWRMWS
jgi:hypothetical protein